MRLEVKFYGVQARAAIPVPVVLRSGAQRAGV